MFLVIKVQYFSQHVGPDFRCLSVRPAGFPQVIQIAHMIGRRENESGFVGITRFYWLKINWIPVSWHATNFIHSRIQDGGTREHLSL